MSTTTTIAPPATASSGAGPHSRQSQKVGLSPGSLVHIGERRMDAPRITVIEYDDQVLTERVLPSLKDAKPHCRAHDDRKTVVWLNIDGLHNAQFIEQLGQLFGLHPLVLEDVMNVGQRPKLEEYDDCLFGVLKMLDVDQETEKVMLEQISFVLGADFVVTFQERDGDVFDGVRDRIRHHKGKIRKLGADYLAYALIDAIVDNYFVVVENMSELVEDVEQRLQDHPEKVDGNDIHILKREMLFLRRAILPAREVLGQLARHDENELISSGVEVYFRDVQDHVLQATESLETTREMLASLLDIFHSTQSNRMNEIMRILTVISTIFMPLTFLVGIYGMNFENMPELKWEYGYFLCLGALFLVGLGMFIYMKKTRWL